MNLPIFLLCLLARKKKKVVPNFFIKSFPPVHLPSPDKGLQPEAPPGQDKADKGRLGQGKHHRFKFHL